MMRSSVTPPIEQQLYTRERRGVFRTTEGFDTVAASPGLDPSFIKKVLHPYCVYDAPAELIGRSEKDETKFPASIHLLHLESGETILGQNVYQSADFTGLRSAFFAHNYVLSPERSEDQMKQGGWLDAVFATSYDIEQGTVLPALAELPISPGSGPDSSPTQVLSALKMNEVLFKRLLYAVMQSVATRRKVYIALDLPAEEVTAGAKGLLRLLYTALPYAFRRQLGFMTFAKEPQAKKGIHVQFVERGTLRPKDRNTEKDFTFDLVSGRVTHADASVAKLPYAEFAWALLQEPAAADAFYTFADEMLSGMEPGRDLSIEAYGELAVFYGLEQGMEDLYLDNKSHVLSGLLTYLKPEGGSRQRSRLNELFLTLLSRELDSVKRENVPEEDVAARIGEYFSVAAPVVQSWIVDYFIYGVNNARAQKRMRAVQELYAVLDRDPQLNRAFFDKVLANESLTKLLFEPYLDNQLKRTESAAGVVEVIRRWVTSHPSAIHYSFLQERTANELRERLCSAPNPVQSANEALQRVSVLDRVVSVEDTYDTGITARIGQSEATVRPNRKGGSPSASQDPAYQEELTRLADKLAYVINLFMIQDLDLERVNREQLLSIDILQHGNEVRDWAARQGSDVSARTNMMLAARAWLSGEGNEEEALEALSLAERNELQRWTRRWLAGELQAHPGIAAYEALPMAFYRGGSGSNRLDYPGLIEFIRTNASRAEGLYPFFEWSGDHRMFVRGSNAHKGYADAIVAYFKAHDREAFKSKSAFKPYYARTSKTMKPVYDRAKTELSSPLVRMLTGKRKNLFGLILLILVLGIAGGTYAWMNNSEEPPAASPPSTEEPGIPAEPEVQLAEQIAYMIPATEQEGTESAAQLVIRFRNETGSTEFEQGSLQLTMKDGSTQELDATGKWESFNRNEEPDFQEPSDNGSGSTSEGSTDGSSAGNAGNTEQTEDGDQQADPATSGDATSDPATDATTDTGTNASSNAASGDTDQGTAADQATGTASPDTSVSNEQDADATTSSQMSIGEVDRLYPYGLQIVLPADIDAESIASVQSTQGGMTVIQLMPQPD
ncbi:hypothetical protein [Paenibacillus sp. FSL K6-1318]|uniref:GAP1-N2 domain-containing protein n=1 Tax=Paenibacillus sp. FSL K6-1318 TaxID=2975291 RepID=UPI0030EEDFF9